MRSCAAANRRPEPGNRATRPDRDRVAGRRAGSAALGSALLGQGFGEATAAAGAADADGDGAAVGAAVGIGPRPGGKISGTGRPYRLISMFVVAPSFDESAMRTSWSGRSARLNEALPLAWRCAISSATARLAFMM